MYLCYAYLYLGLPLFCFLWIVQTAIDLGMFYVGTLGASMLITNGSPLEIKSLKVNVISLASRKPRESSLILLILGNFAPDLLIASASSLRLELQGVFL